MKLTLLLLALMPLQAAVPRPHVEVVTTDHVDFVPGGVIRFEGSYGELNIDAWDQPQVEIVVTRFSYPSHDTQTERDRAATELNAIHITASKTGDNELLISTPRHKRWSNAKLDFRIMVPRTSRLVIHHQTGDVVIGDVDGDIDASIKVGDILLRLPRAGAYSFDAVSREGEIVSGFPGAYSRHHLLRENFTTEQPVTGAKRIHLHAGIGGIQIQALEETPIP